MRRPGDKPHPLGATAPCHVLVDGAPLCRTPLSRDGLVPCGYAWRLSGVAAVAALRRRHRGRRFELRSGPCPG